MWVLITIIKLPVTALAVTEAVTILRGLVKGFPQISGALCHLASLGVMGEGKVRAWVIVPGSPTAQKSLGSKV